VNAPLSSTSTESLARELLERSIVDEDWPPEVLCEIVRRATSDDPDLAKAASGIFFREVVERNCDLFEPIATRGYARLFAHVLAEVLPQYSAIDLLSRYQRVRRVSRYTGEPKRVCILSRVTLGADVAITSIALAAAKRRFSKAKIYFAGPAKNAELFGTDPRVTPMVVPYGRSGLLREKLSASTMLSQLFDSPGTLVIDPDSRLTQLGLVPVCSEEGYLFFESRAYGSNSDKTLADLMAQWLGETLQVDGALPYLAPPSTPSTAQITISLGVGENAEKLVDPGLEREAVEKLVSFGSRVVIDRGAGGEEAVRVESLVSDLGNPPNLQVHNGSFAAFANQIARSRLYFGYDSAGQHIAAASAVPLVTVFAGYAAERTYQRWKPSGSGPIHVVKISRQESQATSDKVQQTLAAITLAAAEAGLS
jgi:ADP-heptose:LPS heptosyltransferase